jgi:hypothetical protein
MVRAYTRMDAKAQFKPLSEADIQTWHCSIIAALEA